MPQMAPMLWILNEMITIMMFIPFLTIMYFTNIMPHPSNPKTNKTSTSWKW